MLLYTPNIMQKYHWNHYGRQLDQNESVWRLIEYRYLLKRLAVFWQKCRGNVNVIKWQLTGLNPTYQAHNESMNNADQTHLSLQCQLRESSILLFSNEGWYRLLGFKIKNLPGPNPKACIIHHECKPKRSRANLTAKQEGALEMKREHA